MLDLPLVCKPEGRNPAGDISLSFSDLSGSVDITDSQERQKRLGCSHSDINHTAMIPRLTHPKWHHKLLGVSGTGIGNNEGLYPEDHSFDKRDIEAEGLLKEQVEELIDEKP